MVLFDPWTASLEEAQQQPNAYEPQGSVQQCVYANELTAKRDEIITGDGFSVLQAVAKCAVAGLALPDWLARAFLARYRSVQGGQVGSWDDEKSFGKPYPKGTQMSAIRRRRLNRSRVVIVVNKLIFQNPGIVIDTHFWERVGLEIGEGKTNAQKLHAQSVNMGMTRNATAIKSGLL